MPSTTTMKRMYKKLDQKTFSEQQREKMKRHSEYPSKKKCHDKIMKEYFGMIQTFLNLGKPSIACAKAAIEQLQEMKKFEPFMKETNYFLFDWSIEHENLDLLTYLLNTARREHHLLMVSHDDYKSVKNFITKTLKMNYLEYLAAAESKRGVLKQFFSILDSDFIINVRSEITDKSSECEFFDKDTISAFQNDFDGVFASKENQLDFSARLFKTASSGHKERETIKPSVTFQL